MGKIFLTLPSKRLGIVNAQSVDTFFFFSNFWKNRGFRPKSTQRVCLFYVVHVIEVLCPSLFLTEVNYVDTSIRSRYARPSCRMPLKSARSPIQTRHLSSRQHPPRHRSARTARPFAYFSTHSERFLEGRAIGSGQVGGACKSMAGLRLKQTGASGRYRISIVLLSLCALRYSDAWNDYWYWRTATAI